MSNAKREFLDLETGEVIVFSHQLDEFGREILDPTPIAPPVGYRKEESIFDHVRNLIRSERLALEAEMAGAETFEESEDFEIGDDFEPNSAYENDIDVPLSQIQRDVEAARAAAQLKDGPNGRGMSQDPAPPAPAGGVSPAGSGSGGGNSPPVAPEAQNNS